MLLIRCAACGRKMWRYDKIGPGEVLRCHKERIRKQLQAIIGDNGRVACPCGKRIGIDKGNFSRCP